MKGLGDRHMTGISNIGLRSIMAYQNALTLSSQNIANVDTPFYSRRKVDFSESIPIAGSVFGNGVEIADVRRIYDDAISKNLQSSTSKFSTMDAFLQRSMDLESLLDNPTNSIATYFNDSLNALQQLNVSPASYSARASYLNTLNTLALQFQTITSETMKQHDDVNKALNVGIAQINQILSNIADVNDQLQGLTPSGQNGLLDEREKLIQQLSQYISFDSNVSEGQVLNIFLSNGIPLVLGTTAAVLATSPDSADATKLQPVIKNGSFNVPITAYIKEGELSGLIQYRDDALDHVTRGLGRLALAVADTFNKQSALGIDLNGNAGGNIFNDINDPALMSERVIANTNNSGSGVMAVTIDDVNQLTASDYRLLFSSPSQYTLTRLSDNTVVAANTLNAFPTMISVDGFTLQISSGSFNVKDQFSIAPTQKAANNLAVAITDPRKLALAMPVVVDANQNNLGSGTAVIDSITNTTTAAFATPQQLTPPVQIKFITATSYQLVNAQNQALIEGPIAYNPNNGTSIFPTPNNYDPGYRVLLSGKMQAGDVFDIQFNDSAVGDNRNGLIMMKRYNQAILGQGTLNFNEAYHLMSSDISEQVNSAQVGYDSAEVIKQQAEAQWYDISGVSIEEEIMALVQYQQAYQASAKILEAVKNMFDVLMMIR